MLIVLNAFFFFLLVLKKWERGIEKALMRVINTWQIIFTIEVVTKNVAYGPRVYWGKNENIFAGILTLISSIFQFVLLFLPSVGDSSASLGEAIRIFQVLSCFNVLRVIEIIVPVKLIASRLFTVFPVTISLLSIMLSLYYIFSVIGMGILGGVQGLFKSSSPRKFFFINI